MNAEDNIIAIKDGETALGIELGSTRIKSVLINKSGDVLASGIYDWENQLVNDLWTYDLNDAVKGVQQSYANLSADVMKNYNVELRKLGIIGISAMMHGYLALDKEGRQIAPFLTWRNTNTAKAAEELTDLFQFNIPLRWSIAHLYQAVLEDQEHLNHLDYITTLAGYIHFLLSGQKVIGIDDASGMFPVDPETSDYNLDMLGKFEELIADKNYNWNIRNILPEVLTAGMDAGRLSIEGAALLDPTGILEAGCPMAPPEGDAATGMAATNSVAEGTGNVSVGTSVFSMVVMNKPLSRIYKDIDIVMTPAGRPAAMVHCNNGTSELDSWISLFKQILEKFNVEFSTDDLYAFLLRSALDGDADCGGILAYNHVAGEPIVGTREGRPMLLRRPDSDFNIENLMRSQIFSIFSSLAVGMRILTDEGITVKSLTGHGGLFKTPEAAQKLLAAAMHSPVMVMNTAGEGGPYGMALLAAYCLWGNGVSLEAYLKDQIFKNTDSVTIVPDEDLVESFSDYLDKFCKALPVEALAADQF